MVEEGGRDDALGSWPRDRFYSGTIQKLFPGSQSGVVRSARSGREFPFLFVHVVVVGPLRRFEELREGMLVGFDIGRTSSGLCVTVLRARVLDDQVGNLVRDSR